MIIWTAGHVAKWSIIQALGLSFMQTVKLKPDQTLYLSGCFSEHGAVKIVGESLPEKDTAYASNSTEVDMRCWRHAFITTAQRILIYGTLQKKLCEWLASDSRSFVNALVAT